MRAVKFVHRKYQKKTMYCLLMRQFAKSYLPRKTPIMCGLIPQKAYLKKIMSFPSFFLNEGNMSMKSATYVIIFKD